MKQSTRENWIMVLIVVIVATMCLLCSCSKNATVKNIGTGVEEIRLVDESCKKGDTVYLYPRANELQPYIITRDH